MAEFAIIGMSAIDTLNKNSSPGERHMKIREGLGFLFTAMYLIGKHNQLFPPRIKAALLKKYDMKTEDYEKLPLQGRYPTYLNPVVIRKAHKFLLQLRRSSNFNHYEIIPDPEIAQSLATPRQSVTTDESSFTISIEDCESAMESLLLHEDDPMSG